MKLTYFPYELRLRHVFTVATMSRTTTPDVQVEIEHDGVVGYGEASMPPYLGHTVESVCAFLSKVDLSQFNDPTDIDTILDYVDSLSEGDAPAKAAIDIALYDLVGKIKQKPVYELFGIKPTVKLSTSFTIGIDEEQVVIEKTKEAAPYNILKVKVGRDPQEDHAMINAIRSVTDKSLYVDANQGWKDKNLALDMIHWLHEQGVVLIEQPMPKERIDDIAYLTENSPMPVIADESVQRASDIDGLKGAFSGINIKLVKSGGLREAYKMIQKAQSFGMKIMFGCMTETSCNITAASHLACVGDYADLDGNLLIANDRFSGVKIIDGKLNLNTMPGLGLTLL